MVTLDGVSLRWGVYLGIGLMEYALITHDACVLCGGRVPQTPLWVTIVSLWSSLDGSICCGVLRRSLHCTFARMTANKYLSTRRGRLGDTWSGCLFCLSRVGCGQPLFTCRDPYHRGAGPQSTASEPHPDGDSSPCTVLGLCGNGCAFCNGLRRLLAANCAAWSAALRRWVLVPWASSPLGSCSAVGGAMKSLVGEGTGLGTLLKIFIFALVDRNGFHSLHHHDGAERPAERMGNCAGVVDLPADIAWNIHDAVRGEFVHSFTQTPIGPVFLAFLGFCTVVSLLLAMRIDVLSPPSDGTAKAAGIVSRDTMFLLNNLLFAAFTFTDTGTVYPLINEAMTQNKLSIGEPYFNELGVLMDGDHFDGGWSSLAVGTKPH